jgi:hypothetical protein
LNYNYIKKSKSNLTIPGLSENPIYTDNPNVALNGVIWGIPQSDIVNVVPNARGVITLGAPPGWGPDLFGYPFLSNTNLSFQLYYQGGDRIKHPRAGFNEDHPDVWFTQLDRFWVNMRLAHRIDLNFINFEVYLDISNIYSSSYRYPPGGASGEDYYDDLWASGRIDHVGTDQLSDPKILRTENDDVYWGQVKQFIVGLRINI